jgi:hypothetical protein
LAIGRFDNEPYSLSSRIFSDGVGTNGPDPVGGLLPIDSWDDNVVGRIDFPTSYRILLTGAEFASVPEPASLTLWSVFGMIGVGYGRCRKRRSH